MFGRYVMFSNVAESNKNKDCASAGPASYQNDEIKLHPIRLEYETLSQSASSPNTSADFLLQKASGFAQSSSVQFNFNISFETSQLKNYVKT